jgi:hypothetical protein
MALRRRPDLARLYARGIAACRHRDAAAVGRVLLELIARLNFEYEAAAGRLGHLYVEALERARRNRFRRTLRLFRALRAVLASEDGRRARD